MAQAHAHTSLLVAAFDFGTTYSGYAFSYRDDPMKVRTNSNWVAGSECLLSLKTPTCVLLKPSGEFDSFGFQAEDKYLSLLDDEDHHGWRLFRRFKMFLHGNKTLSRNSKVEDIDGKPLRAMTIFTMSIKYLRDHFITAFTKQTDGVLETDVQYVLTVPAIWDDNAKLFMREAAIEAGIDSDRLKLALEPEAASVWCEKVSTEAKVALAGSGTKYMVVDLGGGTADISVHEKKEDGSLREIHRASGGPWGGIYVDQEYLETLALVFGREAIERLKSEGMGDYLDMLRELETKKRNFSSKITHRINFRISSAMREFSEEFKGQTLDQVISSSRLSDKIAMHGRDKIRVDVTVVQGWFDGPVNKIIKHIKELLTEPKMKTVQTILLVGGFGESLYVQERLQKEISNMRLIVPAEAGLVILKGAVRFGHEPEIVSSRVMKYTYGTGIYRKFDEKKHPVEAKEMVNGIPKAKNCFSVYVKIDEDIATDHEVTRTLNPNFADCTTVTIFRSTKADPMFTTEKECEKLDTLRVQHSGNDSLADKSFTVTFKFGDTELLVKSRMKKTGEERSLTIDCLK